MSPRKKPRIKTVPPPPTPKAKHSYDVQAAPEFGDDKEETTYAAVGRALTNWELFENQMSHLFSVLCGNVGPATAAARAYGAIQTFRGHKEMIEAAAEYYFLKHDGHEALQKRLKDLLESANGFSARRNEIAHGYVGAYRSKAPHELTWVLRSGPHNTNKRRIDVSPRLKFFSSHSKYAYSSTEIDYYSEYFTDLEVMAGRVRQELAAINVQAKKSPQGSVSAARAM